MRGVRAELALVESRVLSLRGEKYVHERLVYQFSKCSHFSNIRCFLERFFAHDSPNVVVQSYNHFSHLRGIVNF